MLVRGLSLLTLALAVFAAQPDSTEFALRLDEASLVALVPAQSGLSFVGCPNCTRGHQERQLVWSPERPREVRCRHCGHVYPSLKYPMDKAVTARGPNGETSRYPYWEDPSGYRYFFEARRDYGAREYLERSVRELARLHADTGKRVYARRAALIIDRFAEVFPRWCYHYDMPFQQKIIYDGDVAPEQFRAGYRTARWARWAYHDIPIALLEAYETLRPSGVFEELARERGACVTARIENDLFRNAARQVLSNPDPLHNMSPTAWYSLAVAGRVLGEPDYIREVERRMHEFLRTRFHSDGAWMEGAPSYHDQVRVNLNRVIQALGGRAASSGISETVARSSAALLKLRLPDGRLVPVHDTWHYHKLDPLDATGPFLLPALGHACLGGGRGARQTQFHLTWSGGYGHEHADNLSLLAYTGGREALSDIGYTHTKYRSWAVATASHNTVVVDGLNQQSGRPGAPSDGSLLLYDAGDARVQVVSAGGERAYPEKTRLYRRTLIAIGAGTEDEYAVDLFEVDGGSTHDYFLHGDADRPSRVAADVETAPIESLLPAGFAWRATRHEGEAGRAGQPHYAYGFLRNLRSAGAPAWRGIAVRFTPGLRATLFAEPGSTLVVGENPSIRPAAEDEGELDSFTRPFVMLRHAASNGRSRFAAVLEPHCANSGPDRTETIDLGGAALAVRLVRGERTDLIVVGAPREVSLPLGKGSATFRGEAGVLMTRGGKVEHAYALGAGGWKCGGFLLKGRPRVEARLLAAAGDTLTFDAPSPPPAGATLRLITADGWTYPFTVASATNRDGRLVVRVSEAPGLAFDPSGGLLRFMAFPAREHHGGVRADWFN